MPGDGFIPQGRFWKKSKKISSKLNERGRVLVPSFGSADRSEISKKFLSWQTFIRVRVRVRVRVAFGNLISNSIFQLILSVEELYFNSR